MAYGIYLPDGNTLVPTHVFNSMVDELRNTYWNHREFARNRDEPRQSRCVAAQVATVCRHALRTLTTHEFCRAQTRIA